jgi:CRP-like cAMP-binding protein
MTQTAAVEHPEPYYSPIADDLAAYSTVESWPAGKVLFREGAQPAGVYFVHAGEVDLHFAARRDGQVPLLCAGPGNILGLTSVMSDRPHDCTATTTTPVIAGFVEKHRFLQLLDEKPTLWLAVLRMISSNISACWDCMRALGRK